MTYPGSRLESIVSSREAGDEREGDGGGLGRSMSALTGGCEVKTGSSSVHVGRSDVSDGGLGGGHVGTGEGRRGSVEMSEGEMVESVGGGEGDDGWEINAHD